MAIKTTRLTVSGVPVTVTSGGTGGQFDLLWYVSQLRYNPSAVTAAFVYVCRGIPSPNIT